MRRKNAALYNSLLKDIPGIILPVERPNVKNVYWMYSILIDRKFGMGRKKFMEKLKSKGIETRTFFIPLHNQPILKKMGIVSKERYSVADDIARRGLYLPSGSGLKKREIEYICDCIRTIGRKRC